MNICCCAVNNTHLLHLKQWSLLSCFSMWCGYNNNRNSNWHKGLNFTWDWKHWISAQLTVSHFCLLQKLRDIFALEARRTLMSFCGTPSMPCRKPVSMATLSKALFLNVKSMNISYMNSDLFLFFMSVGLTGRHRPQRWFTRSLEVTSGQEVLPFFFSTDRNAENKNASTAEHCPHICCFSYLLVIHCPVDQTSTSLNNKYKILKFLEITLHIV